MNCSPFLVLTLGLGIAVLCVVIVMDCIRNIALDLRHIRIPGASGTVTSVPASGDGKNWLWKLLFNNSALSLASQFCVVKWHWEEPQVVGNTMSFTVKVCGYKVSPAVVRVHALVDALCFHNTPEEIFDILHYDHRNLLFRFPDLVDLVMIWKYLTPTPPPSPPPPPPHLIIFLKS